MHLHGRRKILRVSQLSASQTALQQQFEQLQVSLQPPAPLPALLTPASVAAMQSHPYLADSDRLYAALLQISLPLVTVDDDATVLQRCYEELAQRIASASEFTECTSDAPAMPPSNNYVMTSAPLPPADNVYVSKSWRRYDTTQPPPYPCRVWC